MKKIITMILALCLLCGAAALAETEITQNWGEGTTMVTLEIEQPAPCCDYIVTIPSTMTIDADGTSTMQIKLDASDYTATDTITIHCGRHGDVRIDGKKYSGTFAIEAPRLGTLVITADPDEGYGLNQITADDLTGVTIKGKKATLANIHDENTLTISFYKLPVDDDDDPTPEPTATLVHDPTFEPLLEIEDPILGEPTLGDVVTPPEIEPVNNILHDEFIGTGDGLSQLHIVFDGDYEPEDYELLDVFIDDEEQGNSLLVCAFPDEEGNVARRSLILSADQLVKLTQKQETEHIIFENGSAIAEMDMADLLGGDMSKLMALILEGKEEITPEVLTQDWSFVEPVVIPAWQLKKIDVETRIVPVEMEDGGIAYEVSVWLRWDGNELDVFDLIPSLTVAIAVDELVTEENNETFATLYAIAHQAPDEDETDDELPDITVLPGAFLLMPDELPEHQNDTAEHFIVTVADEEKEHPVTAYNANAHLVPYRHYTLAAAYAGKGVYWVQEAE